MRRILALPLLFLFASCQPTPPNTEGPPTYQPSPDEIIGRTTRQMQTCFSVSAKALDDGKSDASTIASAVASRCSSEVDAALAARTGRMSLIAYDNYIIEGRKAAVGAALQFVLEARHRP